MRTIVVLLLCTSLLGAACRRASEPPPPELPGLDAADLRAAAVSLDDLGAGWTADPEPTPTTVQIGGRVGPRNVSAIVDATVAYRQERGTGDVRNSIYMLAGSEQAEEIVEAHRQVNEQREWTQAREDGGLALFTNTGPVTGLGRLGDEAFTARLDVTIRTAGGDETKRVVEYIVFRVGPVVSFVVAQDAAAAPFAQNHARRLADALARATPVPQR